MLLRDPIRGEAFRGIGQFPEVASPDHLFRVLHGRVTHNHHRTDLDALQSDAEAFLFGFLCKPHELLSGIPEWIPWDSSRLDWWPEDELDPILAGGAYGVKVRTPEELEAALRAPTKVAPTRRVWIH